VLLGVHVVCVCLAIPVGGRESDFQLDVQSIYILNIESNIESIYHHFHDNSLKAMVNCHALDEVFCVFLHVFRQARV
jgi:hypothetical protein